MIECYSGPNIAPIAPPTTAPTGPATIAPAAVPLTIGLTSTSVFYHRLMLLMCLL